jgi:predicted GIY-YIG superfamily endonuclease
MVEKLYNMSLPLPCDYDDVVKFENFDWIPDLNGPYSYILLCKRNRLYKGHTIQFKKRIVAHFKGYGCETTSKWPPAYILHCQSHLSASEAYKRERYYKSVAASIWLREAAPFLKTILPK